MCKDRRFLSSFNKHQNNPLVSAETIRHSSTYIILYELISENYFQNIGPLSSEGSAPT